MSMWKLFANASTNTSGPVNWLASGYQQGSGNANEQANNLSLVSNTSPGALRDAPQFSGNGTNQVPQNRVLGQFAFTPGAYANAQANATANATYTGEGRKIPGGTGWVVRKAFEGPITGIAAANGSAFANGETVLISGGSTNAVASLTANATGNLASASVITPGLFANVASLTITFNSEKHVANVQIAANTVAFTNLPAANSPITVTISNTGNSFAVGSAGIPAVGVFQSNIASGITNTILNLINWTGNVNGGIYTANSSNAAGYFGLFSNNQTNSAVVVTFTNANGQVIANGTPATLTSQLVTHAGTPNVSVSTLGGRSGRVMYETLVSTRFIANAALASGAYVNVATFTVTGNTGGLASANSVPAGSYALVTTATGAQTVTAAYITLTPDANGSLANSNVAVAFANGYTGGYYVSGVVNTNLIVTIYAANGKALSTNALGTAFAASIPGGNLTFGGTVGTVSANSATFLPQ